MLVQANLAPNFFQNLSCTCTMPGCFARGLNLSSKLRNMATKRIVHIPSRAKSTAGQINAAQGCKPPVSSPVALSWPEYLAIRRSKRHWQLVSILLGIVVMFA